MSRPRPGPGWSLLGASALSVTCAVAALWPALLDPFGSLIGDADHPDCLGNHWLLDWVAARARAGQGILHNPDDYWPVGDAPVLAGNGTDGLLAAPLLALWPWPAGAVAYALSQRTLDGLAGFLFGRGLGLSPAASALLVPALALSPYALTEASAGRWSQAGTWPLVAALAAFATFLRDPRPRWGAATGAAVAAAGLLYWYHVWFFVLAAAPMAALLGLGRRHARGLAWAALLSAGPLVPWLALFVAAWSRLPGAAELADPALAQRGREAIGGPLDLLLGAEGPAAAAALAWPALLGALSLTLRRSPGRSREIGALCAILLLFFSLALGERGPASPFALVYDLAPPLRRFWWPLRHLLLVHLALGGLAAIALDRVVARSPRAGRALAAAAIVLWLPAAHVQGAPIAVTVRPLHWPREAWVALAAMPDGVVMSPPIAPEAAGSQWGLMAQRTHGHPLLVGHAPWVARVRPQGWDEAVAADPALSTLQALERGAPITLRGAELLALNARGLRYLALDRSAFIVELQPVVRAYDALFDALCGQPTYRDKGVQIWELARCAPDATASAHAPWPEGLAPAGPERPIQGVWLQPSP